MPNIRSNRWPRSWKKYFIEMAHLRGYAMLYPNYADWLSLSTNHVELGTHVQLKAGQTEAEFAELQTRRKAAFEQPLMRLDQASALVGGLPSGRLPDWDALPVLDFWGALASESELVARGWRDVQRLGTCSPRPHPPAGASYDAHELLCPRAAFEPRAIPATAPRVRPRAVNPPAPTLATAEGDRIEAAGPGNRVETDAPIDS